MGGQRDAAKAPAAAGARSTPSPRMTRAAAQRKSSRGDTARPSSDENADEADEMPYIHASVCAREMVTDAWRFSRVEIGGAATIERYLACPICLGLMQMPTATECLHRFCHVCIETALRLGKKECPTCRAPVATRRALRRDFNFESLLRTLCPDGLPDDDAIADLSKYRFTPLGPHPPKLAERTWSSSSIVVPETTSVQSRTPMRIEVEMGSTAPAQPSPIATSSTASTAAAPAAADEPEWGCNMCTLLNPLSVRKCKLCGAPHPERVAAKRVRKVEKEEGSAGPPTPGSAPGSSWERPERRRCATLASERLSMRDRGMREREGFGVADFGTAALSPVAAATSLQMPEPPPELEEGPGLSVEAQLLARGVFAVHIKSVGPDGLVALWCFPTANPGDCSAWISLAPSSCSTARCDVILRSSPVPLWMRQLEVLHLREIRAKEAAARQKYKMLIRNNVIGEVRFTSTDLRRLHDGTYALALQATIDEHQRVLAISRVFRLRGGVAEPPEGLAHKPPAEPVLDEGGLECSALTTETPSKAEALEAVSNSEDGAHKDQGELGEADFEVSSRSECRGVVVEGDDSPALPIDIKRPPLQQLQRADSVAPRPDGRRRNNKRWPVDELASSAEGAKEPGSEHTALGQQAYKRSRWRPRLSDEAMQEIGLEVVLALQQGAAKSSTVLFKAMCDVMPVTSVGEWDSLLEALRFLVRSGLVTRCRGAENGMQEPVYQLSPLAAREFHGVAPTQAV